MGMKRLTLLLASCLFALFLIDSVTVRPDVISGNGNVALLIMFPALFLFLAFYLQWATVCFRWFGKRKRSHVKGCLFLLALLILAGLWAEWQFASHLISALGGGPDVPQSRIYRFGWFNQYTNTLFFNVATFGVVGLVVASGAGLVALGRGKGGARRRTAVL